MSEESEQVGAVEKDQGLTARCPWCDDPVAVEGATCDSSCFALWYTWSWSHVDVLVENPSGRLVWLVDGETVPLDIHLQPWYAQEVGREVEDDSLRVWENEGGM